MVKKTKTLRMWQSVCKSILMNLICQEQQTVTLYHSLSKQAACKTEIIDIKEKVPQAKSKGRSKILLSLHRTLYYVKNINFKCQVQVLM